MMSSNIEGLIFPVVEVIEMVVVVVMVMVVELECFLCRQYATCIFA